MVFLDASPVIYLIEQPATFGPKSTARVTALLAFVSRWGHSWGVDIREVRR
jgi:hypothetical protein